MGAAHHGTHARDALAARTLVVDAERRVRGIFSLSQVARQLGVPLGTAGEVARTFAEIEAAIK